MAGKTGWRGQGGLRSLLVVAAVALGVTGCGTLGLSRSLDGNGTMDSQRVDRSFRDDTLVSRLKPVRLRLQNGWQAAPTGSLHPNADLEAHNLDQSMFLIVLGEDRNAVAPGNLEDQANFYLQILKGGFAQVIGNQARTGVERINGFPAVQYEVRGEVSQRPVAYLHTTVEMGDNYYQVVVWTPDDLRVANSEAMRAIAQEFREAQQ
ncbi:hypothetical protein [Nodosilinea sp. E11]|uniref:hypothetical protein n=1 Tax=Nodosilinea sp. E11 TaxID=3037479 RepID=UPI0029342B5A|nr:hypothetical protein [Nodosilinea sp. E11]WOD40797.1 hypothetical protein RRF56_08315 [Nodosilinea sp. E11]